MMEAQWRRTHADPNHLRAMAQALEGRADTLGQPYQHLRTQVDRAGWAGAAAQRFRSESAEHWNRVQQARRSLEGAAATLRNAAARLEAELHQARYEDQLRAAWERYLSQRRYR